VTPRTWYLVGAGLVTSAVALVLVAFGQYLKTVELMQRVVMPGRAEIVLPAGPSTLYAESRSVFDGTPYDPPADLTFQCGLEPVGKAQFTRSKLDSSYATDRYAGAAAFDVRLTEAGTYTLVCEAPQKFVMAIGRGVGAWTVIALVALVPLLGGVVTIALVFFKRRRQRRNR
jgi:hypothetical protein